MVKTPDLIEILHKFDIPLPSNYPFTHFSINYKKQMIKKNSNQNIIKQEVWFFHDGNNHKYFIDNTTHINARSIKYNGPIIKDQVFLEVLDKNLPAYIKKLIIELT